MKSMGSMFSEAYGAVSHSISQCCAPLTSCLDDGHPPRSEKGIIVLRDQPALVPPPSAEPFRPTTTGSQGQRLLKKSFGSSHDAGFSVKKRFRSRTSLSSRRPQISAPTNFRHLHSESYHFPPGQSSNPQRRQRPLSFRPLELSIYLPQNRLSPLLPLFDYPNSGLTEPPAARTRTSFDNDNESVTLTHERSYSSMSFHIPRRPLRSESLSSPGQDEDGLPRIPPRARTRAYTSASTSTMVERIASAMLERDRLQAEIESVVERQSIYINSRPSTAYGVPDVEPMPSIPAMPAAAPSFAERLSTERPQTTSSTQPIHIPRRQTSYEEASAVFQSSPTATATPTSTAGSRRWAGRSSPDRPLAPPLPLVLRPPLRKKKSFSRVSRVSSWLFPGGVAEQHRREMSFDSVTNLPKPVTGRDGFYQCVAPPDAEASNGGRRSSVSTLSTWETADEEEEEERTVPTSTWSPGSSPATKQGTPTQPFERTGLFAPPPPVGLFVDNDDDTTPRASRVGVAV